MRRNQSLDALRGVAILLVIGFHVAIPGLFRIGAVGVDLFFVLSGFLISGLLFRDYEDFGQIRIGRFWFRRAFKILPPLYTFLICMLVMTLATHFFRLGPFLSASLFYMNFTRAAAGEPGAAGLLLHTWSLAVEEHFYLFCPILFYFLAGKRVQEPFRCLPLIALGLYVVCFALRIAKHDTNPTATQLRIDALFTGVTLRYAERFRSATFSKLCSPAALIAGLTFWIPPALNLANSPVLRSAALTWTSVSAALLIAWCYNHDAAGWWNANALKTLSSVGFYSYSIYLWQQPVALFFRDMQPGLFFKACGVVFSIAVGVAMAKLVEIPALRLRDKIGLLHTIPSSSPEIAIEKAAASS